MSLLIRNNKFLKDNFIYNPIKFFNNQYKCISLLKLHKLKYLKLIFINEFFIYI